MENISKILIELTNTLKPEIIDHYNKCYSYIKDLYSYKNIDISKELFDLPDNVVEQGIYALISATNSALKTIGIPFQELNTEVEIFNGMFKIQKEIYSDYNSFFELSLKPYINQYIFKSILEYLVGLDDKKIKNLDLFDLLPKNFLKKVNKIKRQNENYLAEKEYLKKIIENLNSFYDATNFSINQENLEELNRKIQGVSSEDILKQLEQAKRENIEVLGKAQISDMITNNDFQIDDKSKVIQLFTSFLDYFGNFPRLNQELIDNLNINVNDLINTAEKFYSFLDLENLFYFLSIFKILGKQIPFSQEEILKILHNFGSGKVFSTGKYHKPNPISNFFGLSILSELGLINQTEVIDPLDIEMFLENEIKNFLPEKISLNFFTLLSLKILERSGGIIIDKNNLIKPLIELDLIKSKDKNFPADMLYHIGLLKTIDKDINLNIFKNLYNTEIKKLISPMGLVNNNLTDTARALLIYDLLELKTDEYETIKILLNNIISYSNFFEEIDFKEDFNWMNNKLAFKVELRMLFWTLLTFLQFSDYLAE
ncbi:MAG: hypothetical protein ACFE8M_03480 [Candidatus Hermodarchaeota archaeon]